MRIGYSMNVLVACEESQRVCLAFRAKGHNAFSCDILEPSGGHPEYHIQGDVQNVLNPYFFVGSSGTLYFEIQFSTMDGTLHTVPKWDLIIAHPPCTRLCSSGQRWLHTDDAEYNIKKKHEQEYAISFFLNLTMANCEKIAIENPVGIMSRLYRKPDQIYNPYDFEGETECKKTCLWLKGLPKLKPTQNLPKEQRTQGIWKANFDGKQYAWNDQRVASLRSKTPFAVAKAMAEQWG